MAARGGKAPATSGLFGTIALTHHPPWGHPRAIEDPPEATDRSPSTSSTSRPGLDLYRIPSGAGAESFASAATPKFRSCSPRCSSNSTLDPTTLSLTVDETSTSPGPAKPGTRHPAPGTDVSGHPGHVIAPDLDLASVDPGPHADVERLQRLSDGQGALDRSTGTVEGGVAVVVEDPRGHRVSTANSTISPPPSLLDSVTTGQAWSRMSPRRWRSFVSYMARSAHRHRSEPFSVPSQVVTPMETTTPEGRTSPRRRVSRPMPTESELGARRPKSSPPRRARKSPLPRIAIARHGQVPRVDGHRGQLRDAAGWPSPAVGVRRAPRNRGWRARRSPGPESG